MRIDGPSIGPIHTTLWSSGRKHRQPVPWKGWLFLYFTTAALWGISPLCGIPATIISGIITAVVICARHQKASPKGSE